MADFDTKAVSKIDLLERRSEPSLSAEFKPIYAELSKNQEAISQEMIDCQGPPVDFGGYYQPDWEKLSVAMRPSSTFNSILAKL